MRYPASEKLEIIRLPVRRTLEKLGIQPAILPLVRSPADRRARSTGR